MKFDYDDCFDETELVLSDVEIALIKTKAKELRKLCYQFNCCDFDTVLDCMVSDEEEEEENEDEDVLTCKNVVDKLGGILPFVKKYQKKLLELGLVPELLRRIEANIEGVKVSVIDSPLDKDDIHEQIDMGDFEYYEVVDAFFKFCDRETACKVYDYLQEHRYD